MTGRPRRSGRLALSVMAGVAAPLVILGAAVAVFLTPAWIDFEQGRTNVAGLTGFQPADVRRVTGSILSDLVVGPPAFAAEVDGRPVLDAAERSHMVDVRNVLVIFVALTAAAATALAGILVLNRGARWPWRAVAAGSATLALAAIALGVAALISFDALFRVFHVLVFPQGNFEFDPRTQRLVQLFPERFWSETAFALEAVIVTFSAVATIVARRLERQREPGRPASIRP